MSDVTKTCTKCGAEKSLDEFRERRSRRGIVLYRIGGCRVCERDAQKKYRLENLDKCKKALSDWKKKNPSKNAAHSRKSYAKRARKCREANLRWIADNRGHYLAYLRDYGKRSAERLSDSYVARTLRIPVAEAHNHKLLIELKREQLRIFRVTKKLKQEIKNV